MSYIRFNSRMPSGKRSDAYVYAGEKGIINMGALKYSDLSKIKETETEEDCFLTIYYEELPQIFQNSSLEELKDILIEKLELGIEEAEVVSKKLYIEYKNGEWDKYL